MKNDVINLIIAVNERAAILRLHSHIGEELHQFLKVRRVADGLAGLDVDGLALRDGDRAQCFYLPVVEG